MLKLFFLILSFHCYLTTNCQVKIYFPFDEYTISEIENNKLQNILSTENIKAITVIGYTDSVGSIAYNLLLSQKKSQCCCQDIAT